jgi:hypothetical protein
VMYNSHCLRFVTTLLFFFCCNCLWV